MLDINLFREEKGNDPEIIRESQRMRFASVEVVDEIINLDKQWRQRQYEVDCLRKEENKLKNQVGKLKLSGADATEPIQQREKIKQERSDKEAEVAEASDAIKAKMNTVGNLVHDSVPIDNDEANNLLVKHYGETRVALLGEELKNHVDLVHLLGFVDTKRGAKVFGARGYYLEGAGSALKRALMSFGLDFLAERGFKEMNPRSTMRKDVMAKCAQLSQFDEELYKVSGEGDDKYLIATAEQPLCAYHKDEWIQPSKLPKRYAGHSTCFRKEAGSHGRDTLGIFRVHEFGKVEQFCDTSPEDSWAMFDEMIKNAEDFYQALKLPYRVVSVVSGALNDAAAKKYDLEAWFPASGTYRELVSCSNCTDYQARRLEIRYGHKKDNDKTKQYVHMLNSTLVAAERTICCIVENYQREDGLDIPEVLQSYMGGKTFLPWCQEVQD
ncbi:unnamed protein product [Microthlaspi erraticum]|uniref:serine--tRNA ligase n=1 Tax=Microthlaspi erraticum TaxID=1685480 RepID=A0A6D2LFM7_9BRAS|nr:unnamed protein product [Microthlaspi erraticum]